MLLDARVTQKGQPVNPAKHGAMITVKPHKVDLLVKWLERDGIIVASRDDNLRISPHPENDQHDVDCLIDALTKHRDILVRRSSHLFWLSTCWTRNLVISATRSSGSG